MTQFLPPNLLALFEARPPILYLPPPGPLLIEKNVKLPECRFGGVAEYVNLFEDPADAPPKPVIETREEKKLRKQREKEELLAYKVEQGIAQWNAAENPKATEDPYKTLFVGRINYETSESRLKREMEQYGKIKKLSMVHDLNGKPRGYAFIEFGSKEDMHNAYKRGDGQKIDGRRVCVDYERGRTQKSWLPRRLGGGKGDTRRARESRKVLEERDAANGVESRDRDRDRGDRGDRRERGGDRDRERGGDRNGSSRRRSRSRERGDRGGDRGDRGGYDRGDRRDRGDRERGGGYRGGPPAVASYAGGAGGAYGGGGGYGGGRDRESYGGGGYGNGRDGGRDGGYGGGRDRRY